VTSARVSIDEIPGGLTTSATRLQSVTFSGLCALSGNPYEGRLAQAFSGAQLTFGCYYVDPGIASLSAYALRQVSAITSLGEFLPSGSAMLAPSIVTLKYAGPSVYSAVQDASGAYYIGASNSSNASVAYGLPRTGGSLTGYGYTESATKVSLFGNALYTCILGTGIVRASLRTAVTPAPALVTTCGGTCVDFVFQTATRRECAS
jgi:hypothetical protein